MIIQSPSENSGPTEPRAPVPETVRGDVNPYRGLDPHGVAPSEQWSDVPAFDGTRLVEYPPEKEEPDPIPVRIVQEGPKELRTFRVRAFPLPTNGLVSQVLGAHEWRSTVKIKNTGTVTAYILDSPSGGSSIGSAPMNGYPLAQNESVDLTAQTAVYACNDGSTTVPILVIIEQYTVNLP